MPSEDVSIGEEPFEGVIRASWNAGPLVMRAGMPLAGSAAWSASQKVSETVVSAGEAPCEAAIACSISTMVTSIVGTGM
jgi:hypothetical protein